MKLREDETMSREVELGLEALDAALAGSPVPEDERLAQLVRELRAERPEPPPDFAAGLDARAARGFPRGEAASPLARLRERIAATPPRRALAPAGAFVTLLVVGAVAISQSGVGEDGGEPSDVATELGRDTGGAAVEDQVLQEAAPPGEGADGPSQLGPADAAEPGVVAPPFDPTRPGLVPGQDDRKVERAAEITLSTEPDDVPGVADDVVGVTDSYDGIVVSSQVSGTEGERSIARFDLAIPAAKLSDALADLSELADVKSRSESTLDITESFVSARERLADARAELETLLTQLAEADTPRETRSIRARIDIVRGEIAQARGQLEDVGRRARFARVSVTVEGDGGSGGWSLSDAADDALDVLRTIAGVALVSLAVLVPLAVLVAIFWIASRAAARRRRERALD
jgi:hypothetical protein